MVMLSSEEKLRFLKALEEDEEFRLAVAGLLGLKEILYELKKLREDFNRFVELEERRWGENNKRWEENRRLWEENFKRWEENNKRWEENRRLWEENFKRWEENNRRWEENNRRWEENNKRWEEAYKRFEAIENELKELRKEFYELRKEVNEVKAYIERVSLTLEEEAVEVIVGRLRSRGVAVELKQLILPDLEVNLYGVTEEVCVIGEVSTRAGVRVVESINDKVQKLRSKYPQLLKPKVIKVLYTMWITDEATHRALEEGVWVVKGLKELTPLRIIEIT